MQDEKNNHNPHFNAIGINRIWAEADASRFIFQNSIVPDFRCKRFHGWIVESGAK